MGNIWSRRGKWLFLAICPGVTIEVIGQENCIQQKHENSIQKFY